jgi:hypothetical protein
LAKRRSIAALQKFFWISWRVVGSFGWKLIRGAVGVIELVTTDDRRVKVETNRTRFADGSRSGPGLILLAREHFLHVDGMNSQLEGWGWEDNDLVARLQLMLGLSERRAGSATHLSHGDHLRCVNGRSRMETANANIARSLARDAQGNFQGTYRADVAAWQARQRASALNVEGNNVLVH